MTPSHPSLRSSICAWLLAGLLLGGCGDAPATERPAAGPADRLLVIDGLEVTFGEVEPYVAFLGSIAPEWSRKAKVQRVLEEFALPLRLAQRAFPEQRAAQKGLAEALCSVATNVVELEAKSELLFKKRKDVTRRQIEPPVAMFLFDPLLTGSASKPIEVPRGYIVAACHGVRESALVTDDVADTLQVGFLTHTAAEWAVWLDAEQRRVADKATYVHPDYLEAMPMWLKLP